MSRSLVPYPFPDPSHLHENLKPIVWSLKIVEKGLKVEPAVFARACGFGVCPYGYIMTCASIFMDYDPNKKEIWARRFDQDTFQEATLKFGQPQWDLALLKVEVDDCECGSFSQEGTLCLGQPIFYIGRSSHIVGSCMYGYVAVGCTDIINLSPLDSDRNMKCWDYEFDPYDYNTSQPPNNTSNMGCFWNKKFFKRTDIGNRKGYKFEKQLHPYVPVIHCDGFSTNHDGQFGSPESPGSPVFNLEGEIVGMLSSNFENFDIAVHVSALLRFKTDSLPLGPVTIKDDPAKKTRRRKRPQK